MHVTESASFCTDITKMKLIPNRDNHKCFACSPVNNAGLKMTFYTDDASVVSKVNVPEHLCGWDNLVHGGIISTILDESMSWGAIYLLKKIILTKTITVDFCQPIYIGEDLFVRSQIVERTSEREAVMEAKVFKGDGVLCARSRGAFALFSFEAMKKKKILSEKLIDEFETIMGTY